MPKLKARETRENMIMLRVSDRELERFRREADREPLATWVRRILLEYVERLERRTKRGER